jgi:hypothetical protein
MLSKFSKVLFIVTSYGKYTSALSYENLFQGVWEKCPHMVEQRGSHGAAAV